MTEEEARAEIVNLLKERNQYAVIWWGHWGGYFHILSNAKGRRKNDIYGAMCEQYYDVVEDDTKVADIQISKKQQSWEYILNWMKGKPHTMDTMPAEEVFKKTLDMIGGKKNAEQ